jgi:hypothetical protein
MVDACTATGCLPFYGPFGDIADGLGCEDQFRAAFLLGCVGAWSLNQPDRDREGLQPARRRGSSRKSRAIPDGRCTIDEGTGRRHLEAVQGHGEFGAAGAEGSDLKQAYGF